MISQLESDYKVQKAEHQANTTSVIMKEINKAIREIDDKMAARFVRHDEKVASRFVRLEDTLRKTQNDIDTLTATAVQSALDLKLTQIEVADLKAKFPETTRDMEVTCERTATVVGVINATSQSNS